MLNWYMLTIYIQFTYPCTEFHLEMDCEWLIIIQVYRIVKLVVLKSL